MSERVPAEVNPALMMTGISEVLASLGRALVCMSRDFEILHASEGLDAVLGSGACREIVGRPAEEVLGKELFGEAGSLRRALEEGQRREGWGASVRLGDRQSRLLSISVAPLRHRPGSPCDPDVAYLVVLRPPETDDGSGSATPTLFSGMVARSPAMLAIFRLAERLEESSTNVLILGESGTGKEMVARAIHVHSQHRGGPFVAVNCGALPADLLESELFGHTRGAFTGAVRDRVGRFELASAGTIFLDEIGEVPLRLQVKLLRVLQERTFERVGESSSRRTEARVIAATNRDLRLAVEKGEFRDDLYYRLRVVPVEIPPLRERREDIEPLALFLLSRVNERHHRRLRLSPEALRLLVRYRWPGNVRELENALEYAVAVTGGQTIQPADLPDEVVQSAASLARPESVEAHAGPPPSVPPGEEAPAADDERSRILAALDAHRWHRAEAAKALGISRATLWRRMRELGLSS